MSTYKVKATKTTTGMQVSAGTRGFEITFDEPNSTNTGMNPVEILLTSFGACQAITATELDSHGNAILIFKHFGSIFPVILAEKMLLITTTVINSLKSATHLTCAVMNQKKTSRNSLLMLRGSVRLKILSLTEQNLLKMVLSLKIRGYSNAIY